MFAYTRRGVLAVTAGASTSLAAIGGAAGRLAAPIKLSADDQISIRGLVNRLYYAIDHVNPADFASVFATDGTFIARDRNNHIQKEVTGHATLEQLGGTLSPRHFISNFVIEPLQDGARVRFSILKLNIMANPTVVDVTAEGDCVARKIANEWKLVRFDHLFDIKPSQP